MRFSRKLLLIINPHAGMRQSKRFVADIVDLYTAEGFLCTVVTTQARGDATAYAAEYGAHFDRIVCIGGDGTFNEVVTGVMQGGVKTPLGYIAAGSTNDFAASMGISQNIMQAARDAVLCEPRVLDVGRFNDRNFTYVASCGAFTSLSYDTPQNAKNLLGHAAYILRGIGDLGNIRPIHLRFELEYETHEDDYIFTAVTNSLSVGGVFTLDRDLVDFSDGMFEVLLIRSPNSALELNDAIASLVNCDYPSYMVDFFRASHIRIFGDANTDWTLDGEYAPGAPVCEVENLHHAISVALPPAER